MKVQLTLFEHSLYIAEVEVVWSYRSKYYGEKRFVEARHSTSVRACLSCSYVTFEYIFFLSLYLFVSVH